MEEQVSKTILEEKESVNIGGESYNVAPPSIATLILFSKYVSKLPKESLSEKTAIASLLQNADKLHYVGYAIASVILGAEKVKSKQSTIKRFWHKIFNKKTELELLAEKINHSDVENVSNVFLTILSSLKLNVFFQLTTSLIEMNLTKPTREVEEMTVSGQ